MTIPFKMHDRLTTSHGFFGRQGGVSKNVYESLNVGQKSDDNPDDVMENRRRVADALSGGTLDPQALVSLAQIHSDIVEIITEPPKELLEADGLVTKTKGLALSALSADCGPVLFHDPENEVIGACHAGWRGALGGIVESTVAAMCEVGASTENITAILGPCISQPNYEVGEAFKTEFMDIDPNYAQFFKNSPKGIPHFDLPAFIVSRLKACDIHYAEWMGDCTYGDSDRYFSYRRNTHQGLEGYGRNISAIILK